MDGLKKHLIYSYQKVINNYLIILINDRCIKHAYFLIDICQLDMLNMLY